MSINLSKKCYFCHKEHPRNRCGKCQLAYYCDIECQRADWKAHKKHCVSSKVFNELKAIEAEFKCKDPASELPLFEVPEEISLGSNSDDSFNRDECGICLETIVKGVTLPCHHSLCSTCLESYRAHTFDASCPFCRSPIPKDPKPYLLQNAAILVERSNRRNDKEDAAQDLGMAREYVDRLLKIDVNMTPAKILLATLLSKAEDEASLSKAISVYKDCIGDIYPSTQSSSFAVSSTHGATPDSAKSNDTAVPAALSGTNMKANDCSSNRGNTSEQSASEYTSFPGSSTDDEDAQQYGMRMTCFIGISELSLKRRDYKEAMRAVKGAMSIIKEDDIRLRKVLSFACDCEFHAGKYQAAVEFGTAALDMNPYFPGSHYQVARAQEAMGHLDAAILSMEKAADIETPWDESNKETVRSHLRALLQAKAEQGSSEERSSKAAGAGGSPPS